LGAALLLSIIVVLFSVPDKKAAEAPQSAAYVPAGMEPLDAERLQHLNGWRVAGADDFSPAATQFLQQHGLTPLGRFKGDFSGRNAASDSAYLLIDSQGKRRITMLAGGVSVYDAIYDQLELIAVVPKANLASIQSTTQSKFDSDGDGLLLVRNVSDPTSGLILVRHGQEMDSARPLDFTAINLYSGQ
jgi:hypothetical protein